MLNFRVKASKIESPKKPQLWTCSDTSKTQISLIIELFLSFLSFFYTHHKILDISHGTTIRANTLRRVFASDVVPPHLASVQSQFLSLNDSLVDNSLIDDSKLQIWIFSEFANPNVFVTFVWGLLVLEDGISTNAIAVGIEFDISNAIALDA